MYRQTFANINLKAIRENIRILRSHIGSQTSMCCMLKANAYGHGDLEVAKLCQQEKVNAIGVSSLDEAMHLRENQISSEIWIFSYFDSKSWQILANHRLTPMIGSLRELKQLALQKISLDVHLLFNTGMQRMGFSESEIPVILEILEQNSQIQLKGICTHMLNGEDAHGITKQEGRTYVQFEAWKNICNQFNSYSLICHIFNSPSALAYFANQSSVHMFGVRIGLSLYGLHPIMDDRKEYIKLQPVMSVYAQIQAVHLVKKGESVSYSGRWIAPVDSVIAVVAIGYGDGLFRTLSNQMEALFEGNRIPQVGTICMDYCMFDFTKYFNESNMHNLLEKQVCLIGKDKNQEISAHDLANKVSSIAYEILCHFGSRLPRVYID